MVVYGWKIQLGTLPDWLVAIGTVSATVALVIGLLREKRLRRIDDERRDEERWDAQANQARLISTRLTFQYSTQAGWRAVAILTNDSDAPVADLRVKLVLADPGLAEDLPEATPPPENPAASRPFERLRAREPSQRLELGIPHVFAPPVGTAPSDAALRRAYLVELWFTDSHGRRWCRRGTEQPSRAYRATKKHATLWALIKQHRRAAAQGLEQRPRPEPED